MNGASSMHAMQVEKMLYFHAVCNCVCAPNPWIVFYSLSLSFSLSICFLILLSFPHSWLLLFDFLLKCDLLRQRKYFCIKFNWNELVSDRNREWFCVLNWSTLASISSSFSWFVPQQHPIIWFINPLSISWCDFFSFVCLIECEIQWRTFNLLAT